MPIDYDVFEDGHLVLEAASGHVRHDELIAHDQRLASDASIRSGARSLADIRRATCETVPETVHEVTEQHADTQDPPRIRRVALVVPEQIYPAAREYARQLEAAGVTVILFNALPVACTWLGIDVDWTSRELDRIRPK